MVESGYRAASVHYDEAYFRNQSASAEVGAKLVKDDFAGFIRSTDVVIDFGCGGGFLLNELNVIRKVGIEINAYARAHARAFGIDVFESTSELPEGFVADAVISNHALEHVEEPLLELRRLAGRLNPGGVLVLIVPCDAPSYPFREVDPDFHLYSWSANNIANLAKCAGFVVHEASEIRTRWPPKWAWIYKFFGLKGLRVSSQIWGRLPGWRRQVRLVAVRRIAG
jgi:SAM-dependent methyltransferase